LAKLDVSKYSKAARADLQELRKKVESERQELETQAKELAAVAALVPFAPTIIQLEEARRRMEKVQPAAAAGRLTDLRKEVDRMRQGLGALKLTHSQAARGAGVLAGLNTALRNWNRFYDGYDPLFTWWMAEPSKEADQALGAYLTALREVAKRGQPDGTPLKPATFGTPGPLPPAGSDVPDLGEMLTFP